VSQRCPSCGSTDTEWIDIYGHAVDPMGSIYECLDCGRQFKIAARPKNLHDVLRGDV
jgi:DNA-directed RNA polymerase subunit RPC12/RpoP